MDRKREAESALRRSQNVERMHFARGIVAALGDETRSKIDESISDA